MYRIAGQYEQAQARRSAPHLGYSGRCKSGRGKQGRKQEAGSRDDTGATKEGRPPLRYCVGLCHWRACTLIVDDCMHLHADCCTASAFFCFSFLVAH